MRAPPILCRVEGALRLQPMTIRALAKCLSVSDEHVRDSLNTLTIAGRVRRSGWKAVPHGMAHLFELKGQETRP